ncbi:MAG: hypothetical protein J7J72_06325 [Bacteroidales bacterium]|nr:hypothetical protein [Bacteroidales bacterium]
MLRNKFSESGEVILFGNEAKNAGIAELRRGFLTKLAGKRTSINGVVISQQALSKIILKLVAWKVVGTFPEGNKFVIVAAPYTSNWDFILGRLGLLQHWKVR